MSDPFLLQEPDELAAMLHQFSPATRQQGHELLRRGAVAAMNCLKPGESFQTEVQDDEVCTVQLNHDQDLGWHLECSCKSTIYCKHLFAALKTLLAEHTVAQVQTLSGKGFVQTSASATEHEFQRLVQNALGRSLRKNETTFLGQLGQVYRMCKESRRVESRHLQLLGLPVRSPGDRPLVLAPFPIESMEEFWTLLTMELDDRQISWPEWLRGVVNSGMVEAKAAQWEQQEEIRLWQDRLKKVGDWTAAPPSPPVPSRTFRVRLSRTGAHLEWRAPDETDYSQPTRRELDAFLAAKAEAPADLPLPDLLLWNAFSAHYSLTRSVEFPFYDTAMNHSINALLRTPAVSDRFANEKGEMIVRSPEPLRWRLTTPTAGGKPYFIALSQPDGQPLQRIDRVFAGQPTLYLSDAILYEGPPIQAGVLNTTQTNAIPAQALETSHGIALLKHLEVEIPEAIKTRIREELIKVKIECRLETLYEGSQTEICVLKITARSETLRRTEVFAGTYWRKERAETEERSAARSKETGLIHLEDRSLLNRIPYLLEPLHFKYDSLADQLSFRVTRKFPQQFSAWLATIPPGIEVVLLGELASFHEQTVAGRVTLEVKEADQDWFDLRVVLDVTDLRLTPEEIKLLLKARGNYVRLEGKGWKRLQFDLSDEENAQLADLGLSPREMTDEPQRFHVLQLAGGQAKKFLSEDAVALIRQRAAALKASVTPPLPAAVQAQLRAYQEEGYHFLCYLSTNRFGGILADDMGLGKTLQTLAWLAWLREQHPGQRRPSLVVCPKSVMDNWRAEAEKFVPGMKVKVWSAAEVNKLPQQHEEHDLHVLNYNQLRLMGSNLARLHFEAVILDEGQYIKNASSQTTEAARALTASHRLVLTGTPIENRLLDLWSILSFAMPGMLGNRSQFGRIYDSDTDPLARRRLSARVRPFLLRRTKLQVAKDLPERIEEDLLCEMEGEQKTLYSAELKRAQQLLLRVKTQKQLAKEQFHFLTSLLRLRQICCSPRLIDPQSKVMGAKVEALLEQLEPLMEEGQKVLVFSQFVSMLSLLKTELEPRGWPQFYLAGETENRGELVQSFQNHEGPGVFLISLKAGGFGLNLTAASYVVLFDPWWNPAVENQAIDRTHRIGQQSTVIAYRLLIKGSVEEKIRNLQKQKSALAEDVLGEEQFAKTLTLDDLQFLLS